MYDVKHAKRFGRAPPDACRFLGLPDWGVSGKPRPAGSAFRESLRVGRGLLFHFHSAYNFYTTIRVAVYAAGRAVSA
eukprot:scaffold411086_cov25-Prasinocladus_malaysianus.AAC.1